MRLEEYWGVGPKTRATLTEELGVEAAVEAIETGDVRTLTDAGLAGGRATRILRRAASAEGMDLLATGDARQVYRDLLEIVGSFAVTARAGDRIRVLTPLVDRTAIERRLDRIEAARSAWEGLSPGDREAVLAAFDRYDEAGETERAAVAAANELRTLGVAAGPFEPLSALDPADLERADAALAALDGDRIREGADGELDRLRTAASAAETLSANALDLIADLREQGVRDTEGFREGLVEHVDRETSVSPSRVRDAMPESAADATAFVSETLRTLAEELRAAADERERELVERYRADREETADAVETAVAAVDDLAFDCSVARFAAAHDCSRPTIVDGETVAVAGARNPGLVAAGEDVQPITYAIGDAGAVDARGVEAPAGDRVAVITGANSGGKTTLLETLCAVALLASMGLPVPAEEARVSTFDAIVFHRRHASFNAGVLESTLRNIVPPLADGGRTLMLVDEFEAITEPGRAADLLHGLVTLTVGEDAVGAFVTHLADDLEPLPPSARIDGISAEGLTPELDLEVDYQPRFGEVGRSTPEFIVSRLLADADDRAARAGFETLAESIGVESVQRTLADARWQG